MPRDVEMEIAIALAKAMAQSPMIQGPDGQPVDELPDIEPEEDDAPG